jgi:uncharacterized membrane protein YdfJ with MMPL/SSD domain
MAKLGSWVLDHKRVVVAFWVLATVAGVVATTGISSRLDQKESISGREGCRPTRQSSASTATAAAPARSSQ